MSVMHMSPSPTPSQDNKNSHSFKKIPIQNSKQKNVSYEDLLLGQYLEQIQPQEQKGNQKSGKKIEIESPYLQKLSHSNFLQTIVNSHRSASTTNLSSRNNSALGHRPGSGSNNKNFEKFEPYMDTDRMKFYTTSSKIMKGSSFDSADNLDAFNLSLRGLRPSSAPIRRPDSMQSIRINSNRTKKNYRRQPNLIRATAFRNGSRQISAQIAARNIGEFLQIATDRLQFNRAARRIFLENGDEIKIESQFFKNAIVYVSCGEDFNDPFLKTKEQIDKKKSIVWTSDGVQFLNSQNIQEYVEQQQQQQKEEQINENPFNNISNMPSKLSKKERLIRNNRFTKRLVAYANGTEYNPSLVVLEYINPSAKDQMDEEEVAKLEKGYIKDFLEECTNRMNLSGIARQVYNWDGQVVKSLDDVPRLEKCLQSLVNEVEYAPVWITKGEGFDARGALFFMENLIKFTKTNRKELTQKRNKCNKALESLKKEKPQTKTISIRILEVNESLREINTQLDELNQSITNLESIYSNIESLNNQQTNEGYQSLFKHIKSLDTSERIFGGLSSKGIKLKVFINGTNDSFDVFFNLKDWSNSKGNQETEKSQFHQLLEEINRVYNRNISNLMKFTRIFTESGDEIKTVSKIINNEIIWVSKGENWKGPKEETIALSLNISMLFAMRNQLGMSTNYDDYNSTNNNLEQNTTQNGFFGEEDVDEHEMKAFLKSAQSKNFAKSATKQISSNNYSSEYNFKTYIEPLNPFALKKYDKPEYWDIFNERESIDKLNECVLDYNPSLIKEEVSELDVKKASQILIQCKNEENILLNPRLFLNQKVQRNLTKADSIWFHDFQTWKFNKSGYIYNQFFPRICITLNTSVSIKLEIHIKNPNNGNSKKNQKPILQESQVITKKGFAIILGTRELTDKNDYRDKDQQWHFNKFGNIYSKALNDKQMVMTSTDLLLKELSNLSIKENSQLEKYELQVSESSSEGFKELNSRDMGLFLLESFDSQLTPSLTSCQRWAIKQENARSIGEWRFSELSTSLWHKLGLTWPVNEKEELIENFKWPITGYLIPGAPPLRHFDESNNKEAGTRLKVIKNGSIDFSSAITLSRASVKSMMKEFIHCSKVSYRQFEFNNFLDTCTSALGLPNAARRLFDSEGVEHFELTNLKQDEIIYISMGEPWIHPKLVREEQERKMILTNLAEDLNKIYYYNKLRQCQNFVIETSNLSMQEGARLVLGSCCLSLSQIDRIKKGESIQNVIEVENKVDENLEDQKPKKAHQISHENTDAIYAKKFRWPWEVVVNKSMEGVFDHKNQSDDEGADNRETNEITKDSLTISKSYDQEINERFKPKARKSLKNLKLNSQKFAFNKTHGFIQCMDNPNLVFGLLEIENNQSEVVLMRKSEDNVNQRWIYKSNGVIFSRARPNLVLTARITALENAQIDINSIENQEDFFKRSIIQNSQITVQPLIDFENGNVHQKWFIDENIGFIYAFATSDEKNIEITACNKAGICSYYVTGDKEHSQPGYFFEYIIDEPTVQGQENQAKPQIQKALICTSCAKLTRGKFNLTKLSNNESFSCFMGKSKEKSLKQYDGFKYLHDKVDLSATESYNTLAKWYSKMISWRQEKNAKSVLNELSATKTIDIIKLYAYRNGEGRLKPGEMLLGATIQALLDQATSRLQLRNAARRIYTEDGTLILDAHDLITWAIDYYRNELHKLEQKDKSVNNKAPKPAEKEASKEKDSNLLDKVDFNEAPITESNFLIDGSPVIDTSKNTKPFSVPTKSEIKRLLVDYDRTSKIDAKKLFRWPIEIWVSCGEPFISPKVVNKNETKKIMQREQIEKVGHELEIQTHALRQMTGRRLTGMNTGKYKPIKNPDHPVIKEGHWTEVTYEEHVKQNEVNQLKNFVDEMKSTGRKSEKGSARSSSNLYSGHAVTKRVLIYINGDSPDKAIYCWASSIDELNETAKIKLRLNKPIKFFYTRDGKIISRFDDISRDQLICVSTGREFIPPEMRNKDVELKANWHRVKKEEGFDATNIKVNSKRNPIIDVDPFGPPILTTNIPKQVQQLALPPPESKTSVKPPYPNPKSEIVKESTNILNRPSTAKLTNSRKPKNKSKSPKRVHMSQDPKDMPSLDKSISIENFESRDSFFDSNDLDLETSNGNNQDFLDILD